MVWQDFFFYLVICVENGVNFQNKSIKCNKYFSICLFSFFNHSYSPLGRKNFRYIWLLALNPLPMSQQTFIPDVYPSASLQTWLLLWKPKLVSSENESLDSDDLRSWENILNRVKEWRKTQIENFNYKNLFRGFQKVPKEDIFSLSGHTATPVRNRQTLSVSLRVRVRYFMLI